MTSMWDLDEASRSRSAERHARERSFTFKTHHIAQGRHRVPRRDAVLARCKQGEKVLDLALARNISERKLAEESLRESEAYLDEAQRLSHTGSWALDMASNRYIYTSEEFDRIFGFDPQGEA